MSNFRFKKLEVEFIGPFEKLLIVFPEKKICDKAEIHIFTGENGTGKTTILELLTCFNNNCSDITPKIQKDKENTVSVKIDFEGVLDDPNVLYQESFFGKFINGRWNGLQNQFPRLLNEYYTKINGYPYTQFSYAFFAYSGRRGIEQFDINAIQELNNNPLNQSLDFNGSIDPKILLQWIANTKTKEALAFRRKGESATKKYEIAINKIEDAVSEITGWNIKFELEENPLNVSVIVNDLQLSFKTIPEGLKSIISWIADLLMRLERIKWVGDIDLFDRSFVLFLDEIDVHLHPAWQRQILLIVQKLFKNSQIFISTHSPFVVGSVDGAWVYKLKKQGDYSKIEDPILSEDAKSYQAITEEIFGIKQQFGEDVEKELDRFYEMRNRIMQSELDFNDLSFQQLANELSKQSIEMTNIIGMELKRLSRIKGTSQTI